MAKPKKILIAIPPTLLVLVDGIAEKECRTRSDLVRDALRFYVSAYRKGQVNTLPKLDEVMSVQSVVDQYEPITDPAAEAATA